MTSVHLRTNQADAHPSEFGDSVECASVISIPFLPFEIEPYRPGNPRCYEFESSDGAEHWKAKVFPNLSKELTRVK